MWSFIICAPHLMLFVSAVQKDEMLWFCDTCGRENIRTHCFGGKNGKKKTTLMT